MTTSWGGLVREQKSDSDAFCYLMAFIFGAAAGWLDIKVGDLLLTAVVVLGACMVLGFMSPRRPWRWVVLIGIFIPLIEWLAYFFLSQKPERAQIYESFLAFLPGIAGSVGGSVGRRVIDDLFTEK